MMRQGPAAVELSAISPLSQYLNSLTNLYDQPYLLEILTHPRNG